MTQSKRILEHLYSDYTEPFRDPLWNHIYLSPALKKITSTPQFQKLGRIKQLGPAYLVYPGATHTRLNHSLGVFALAKRIIKTLAGFSDTNNITVEGVKSFLCAALLHDLGHFPYAHSLKELPLQRHEKLTAEIIMSSDLKSLIQDELRVEPAVVAAIVDLDIALPDNDEVSLFRAILSGALDPDKLDYLTRDAYFCGLSYGFQDVDFIINKIRFSRSAGLVIDEQGISSIENLLFSKYLMYRSVYWHKTVRIATAMIKKAIYLAIKQQIIEPPELYGLDDEEFFTKFTNNKYSPFSLVSKVAERKLYKMVWEDLFSEDITLHCQLADLEYRTETESRIAARLSSELKTSVPAEYIIIDIPEPISFEVDMNIDKNGLQTQFIESGTVFGAPVVAGFVHALRKIRIFVAPEIASLITEPKNMFSM